MINMAKKMIKLEYRFKHEKDKYGYDKHSFQVGFWNLKKEPGFDFLYGDNLLRMFFHYKSNITEGRLKKYKNVHKSVHITFESGEIYYKEKINENYWISYMKNNFEKIEFSNCNEFLAKMKSFAGYWTELPHTRMHPSRFSYDEEYIDLINPKETKKEYSFEILHWDIVKRPKKVIGLKATIYCKITIEREEILFRLGCISISDLLKENEYIAEKNQRTKYIALETLKIRRVEEYLHFVFSPENINVGSVAEMRLKLATFTNDTFSESYWKKNFTNSKLRYKIKMEKVDHIERDTSLDW